MIHSPKVNGILIANEDDMLSWKNVIKVDRMGMKLKRAVSRVSSHLTVREMIGSRSFGVSHITSSHSKELTIQQFR